MLLKNFQTILGNVFYLKRVNKIKLWIEIKSFCVKKNEEDLH